MNENDNMTPEMNNNENMPVQPVQPVHGQRLQPPEWTKHIVISETPWEMPEMSASVKEEQAPEEPFPIQENYVSEEKPPKKPLPLWLQYAMLAVGFIIVVIMATSIFSALNGKDEGGENADVTVAPQSTATVENVIPSSPSVSESSTVSSTEAEEKTEPSSKEKETTVKEKETTAAPTNPSVEGEKQTMVKKEIIEYFNESANRIKPEAVKIIKNYENRTHNEDKLELPSLIKSIGASILNDKLTSVTEPLEFTTPEDIKARFPVPNEDYSSMLDVEDVAEAVCTESGDEYIITLKLHTTVDTEPGKGAAKAVDCINVPVIRDTAPEFITYFSAEYYDCVIVCNADKETGRITHINYTVPVLVKADLDPGFTQFSAVIGFTFEKDYTIVY